MTTRTRRVAGPAARRFETSCRGDRGAASLEYTGAVVIAGIVVAAVVAAIVLQTTAVGRNAANAVCKLVTAGQGDCGLPGAPVSKKPPPSEPCVVSSNSVSSNREIAVVIVTAKDGRSFEVAELNDGRYRVTKVNSGGLGVETGVGAGVSVTVDDKRYGSNAVADAGIGLEFSAGNVYYTNAEDLKRLLNEEAEDTVEDNILGPASPSRWLWERGQDVAGTVTGNEDYEFPTPDEVYAEGGVVVNASAEATSAADSATADVASSQALGVRTTRDGKMTVYLKTTAEGSAELQRLGVDTSGMDFSGGGASGKLELVTAVTFDSSANLVEVSTQATSVGESKGMVAALFNDNQDASLSNTASGGTVYRASLPIKDDRDRDTALAFLAASGVQQLGGGPVQLATAQPTAVAMGRFQQAAADRGTVTQQHVKSDTSTPFAFEAAGKIEVELGVSADVSTNKLTSTGGEYWDGAQWQTWEGCAA